MKRPNWLRCRMLFNRASHPTADAVRRLTIWLRSAENYELRNIDEATVTPSLSNFALRSALFVLIAATAVAQSDSRPELKTRAVAWTEYDGSFLIDPNSRADMLDFYWTVLARPYPATGWNGSLSPMNPGSSSEQWRRREYSQLNAYRAIVSLPAVAEDIARLDAQQEAALVLAVNNRGLSHAIDSSWVGYSAVASATLQVSNLTNFDPSTTQSFKGAVDAFIYDGGDNNVVTVGHRANMLHFTSTIAALGVARNMASRPTDFATMAVQPFSKIVGTAKATDFVAWPSPGFFPIALLRPRPDLGSARMRWSFNPAVTVSEGNFSAASITANVDGRSVTVQNQRYSPGWPVTWEFSDADLNFASLRSDTEIRIEIANVVVRGQPATFSYTVRLFDEATVKEVGFSPRTALMNISTRGQVGSDDRVMIAGFIVDGTLPVRVGLRSQGASLTRFGIQNTVRAPRLTLFDGAGSRLAENASWKAHPNWRLLASAGVAPVQDDEPGMVITLWPGAYTVILSDDANANGVGIVEAFNIDNLTSARLMNLSTRGVVSSGENALIAGFIIKDTPRTVLIRTQGPSLTRFGIANAVADTTLRVVAGNSTPIASNDDWRFGSASARLTSDLSSFAPLNDREAALVLTLQPGAYTALVESKGDAGVGIVEIFDLQ